MITFLETPESRAASIVDQKIQTNWVLTDVFDDATARNVAIATAPLTFENLFRQDIKSRAGGYGLWYFDIEYGPVPRGVGQWTISFDTTGGTVHKTHSLEMTGAWDADKVAPFTAAEMAMAVKDRPLAVGYHDGQVDGYEKVVPNQQRTYRVRFDKGVVTEALMDFWEAITGYTNSVPWHNRGIGEVLFGGATGQTSVTGQAECDVSFKMTMGKNVTNQSLGSILNVINKGGHEVMDVFHRESTLPDGRPCKVVSKVYTHRVYEALNFYTFLGF